MSQENVEVIREGTEAFNRRDLDAFIALLHPDVVWEENGDVLPGLRGIYRGRAEVRRYAEELLEAWESFHTEVEEITEASDGRVFEGWSIAARGAASGAESALRGWSVYWFADGKVARRQVIWTRDEALEAAGLSE
jgi:ketosteroid isomerase-like protein